MVYYVLGALSPNPSPLDILVCFIMASESKSRAGWYMDEVQTIPDSARRLLERYSGLKPEEVLPHVLSIVRPLFQPIEPCFTPL